MTSRSPGANELINVSLCWMSPLLPQVEVEVETMDKGGNFIGWLYVDGVNHSVSLVEEGLSKVHFTAERSSHYKTLLAAEEKAKSAKLNVSFEKWYCILSLWRSIFSPR